MITVVVGGNAGSEGKGAVVARLCKENDYEYVVRVGGPNAGHTVVANGERFALRQLPVSTVVDPHATPVIAAGSEVDLEVLDEEIERVEAYGHQVKDRLVVDQQATLVEDGHRRLERRVRTGTTGKGIGGARAARSLRSAQLVGKDRPFRTRDTQQMLRHGLRQDWPIMIEGTQGHWLGSHAGYYPYCTSGDCRAIDFLAAAGLPPTQCEVWVVLRTHPIRIAGNSGPLPDETSWEALKQPPEITTVTKKVRRVGNWSWRWAEGAVEANRAPGATVRLALTFADYWWPELRSMDGKLQLRELAQPAREFIREMETRLGAQVGMLGTGPDTQILVRR